MAYTPVHALVQGFCANNIIWQDLRRLDYGQTEFHEYDIGALSWATQGQESLGYARATRAVLKQSGEKLTEPWAY